MAHAHILVLSTNAADIAVETLVGNARRGYNARTDSAGPIGTATTKRIVAVTTNG